MPPLSGDYQPGFSSGLLGVLSESRARVSEWAREKKESADQRAEEYEQMLKAEQQMLDEKATNLLTLQMERGLSVESESATTKESFASRKLALEENHARLQAEVERLEGELKTRQKISKEIELEESTQRFRVQEAKGLRERVREAKQTTIDDLTRGIVNYKYLGLDFTRSHEEDELRFVFTHLGHNDKDEYSFILRVDDSERYQILDCSPPIETARLVHVTTMLNTTDDMAAMVRQMRKEFIAIL